MRGFPKPFHPPYAPLCPPMFAGLNTPMNPAPAFCGLPACLAFALCLPDLCLVLIPLFIPPYEAV